MTNYTFHILAAGDWGPGEARARWGDSSHAVPPEALPLIERAWEAAGARPGVKLFDGPMCRLESWAAGAGGRLELSLSRTSYKAFMGTNLSHPELADRFGPRVLANPVGVSPALQTTDGFLVLGRRNAAVAYYPGRVHPFAGSLEPDEGGGSRQGGDGPDVFAAVRRELSEELSFTDDDIAAVRCTGIVEDARLRQPEFIFHVTTRRTRAQVESRVAADEHESSWSVRGSAGPVGEALNNPLLTPVAAASLLLWGRTAFGAEWFAAHSPRRPAGGSAGGADIS